MLRVVSHINDDCLERDWLKEIFACMNVASEWEFDKECEDIPQPGILVTDFESSERAVEVSGGKPLNTVVFQISDEFHRVPALNKDVAVLCKNYAPTNFDLYRNMIPFPLGPNSMIPEPSEIKNVLDREIDISFVGQWHNPGGMSSSFVNRKSMFENAMKLVKDFKADVRMTDTFCSNDVQPKQYAEILDNSKFVLCPWGGSPETFRIWEALRAGCIPIVQRQPIRPWFIENWPCPELKDWKFLPDLVRGHSDETLLRLQVECFMWWKQICDPKSIAAYIVDHIATKHLFDANLFWEDYN